MKALASLAINYQANSARHTWLSRVDQRHCWVNSALILVKPSLKNTSIPAPVLEENNPHFVLGYN